MREIIVGKQNIIDHLRETYHVHSWFTVKRWKKKGFPIRYLENRPFILASEVMRWAVEFDNLSKIEKS